MTHYRLHELSVDAAWRRLKAASGPVIDMHVRETADSACEPDCPACTHRDDDEPGHPFAAVLDGTLDIRRPKTDGGPSLTEYLRSRGER